MRAAVIYDTSFLMSERYRDVPKDKDIEWTTFVPVEVKREIHGHFANPEKERWAKAARKRFATLLAAGCEEVELSTQAKPVSYDDLLGADSDTDKLLIGFAKHLLENSRFDIVYVATDDGGILCDIAKMSRVTGLKAYGISPDSLENGGFPGSLEDRILPLLQSGEKIEAIKLYRQKTGLGFKEAKDAVEALAAGQPIARRRPGSDR